MTFLVQIGKIWISALNQVKTDARKTDLKQTGMLPSWIPTIYLLNFRPWAHKSLHNWVFPSLDWDLKPGFLVAAVLFLFLLTMQWVSIDGLNRRNYYFEHLWTTSPVYHHFSPFLTISHGMTPWFDAWQTAGFKGCGERPSSVGRPGGSDKMGHGTRDQLGGFLKWRLPQVTIGFRH